MKNPQARVSKEDIKNLIDIIKTCIPLWNYKLSSDERSEHIKNNMWNHKFANFNGKTCHII